MKTVRLEPLGREFDAPADSTLLAAAQSAGYELPSSCRNGTCRACITQLIDGQVSYTVAWPGLSAEEKTQGWVLPCVAKPSTDVVLMSPLAQVCTQAD